MEEWKKYKWGDLITLEYGKPVSDKDCINGEIPVYGTNGQIGTSNLPPLCKHSSIIIGRKGAYRGVHYSNIPFSVIDTAFFVKSKTDKLHIKWAYYKLLTLNINRMDSGSAIPSTDRYEIYSLPVSIPSIEIQKRIANLLSALDDKIALNKRINDNLEISMRTLFNFYFNEKCIESDEYTRDSLTEIANFTNGLAMQKFRPKENEKGIPVLKIKELGQGFCDSSSDICSPTIKSDYLINDGDVIFSWSGTLLVDIWCGGKCGLNQHLFKVTSNNYPLWFAYLWTIKHLDGFIRISKDKAVTMGHIKRIDLEKAEVFTPNNDILHKLDKIFTPIFNSYISVKVESRKLGKIRDCILPKLMLGELKIEDLNS